MKITSEPVAISWALLYVADGFNFANKNLAWEPCWSHTTNLEAGNRSWMISLASSWGGACNSWANAWCSGMACTSLAPMLRPVKSAFFGSWLSNPTRVSTFYYACLIAFLWKPDYGSQYMSQILGGLSRIVTSRNKIKFLFHFYWIHWNLSIH